MAKYNGFMIQDKFKNSIAHIKGNFHDMDFGPQRNDPQQRGPVGNIAFSFGKLGSLLLDDYHTCDWWNIIV